MHQNHTPPRIHLGTNILPCFCLVLKQMLLTHPPFHLVDIFFSSTLWHHSRSRWSGRYNLYHARPGTHAFACIVYCRFSSHQYGWRAWCPGRGNHRYARHRSQYSESCCGCGCHLRICQGSAHSKRHDVYHGHIVHDAGSRHIAAQNLSGRKYIQRRRRHSKTAHELRSRRYNDRHV